MASNAQVAAQLLRNAARFFRDVGGQNPPIQQQMETNAQTYEVVATLVEDDPVGELPKDPGAEPGGDDAA